MCSHSNKDASDRDHAQTFYQSTQKSEFTPVNKVNVKPENEKLTKSDEKLNQPIDKVGSEPSAENDRQSPNINPEVGIFNKLSNIWTNRNESTASETSKKHKDQPNLVKSFKKFFKD